MAEPTQPPSCAGCTLYGVAKGFVLGTGDPARARYTIILEAPGKDEVCFELKPNVNRSFLQNVASCEQEYAVRKRDYPELDDRWLRLGMPIVGPTGGALMWWIWPKVGMKREEFFIDNTIRCLPPKAKSGVQYPTGKTRKDAEKHCRQYDRIDKFNPDAIVFSLHPASLLREITPLPLVVKDFEKVRDFTQQERRVLALLGGKAAKTFAGYGENSGRWRGHYFALAADWYVRVMERLSVNKVKRKKVDKMINIAEDIFGVPETVIKRAKEKRTRPDTNVIRPGSCKQWKRHTHVHPPKCGHSDCWDQYERKHEIFNQ